MSRFIGKIFACLIVVSVFGTVTLADTPVASIRKSLLRITVTMQDANYRVPWLPGGIGGGVGTGFVISGDRILTNAHVVSNARFITIKKEDDPKEYMATVKFIAHDCDLAVLTVNDANFFKGMKALTFDGIPEMESSVSAYGYPIGGDRLSVTRGIVSRIDFQTYSHSGIDQHLAIQIDAAINPGNSGGPVMQNGKVVGIAFQGYGGDVAQDVAYMIPTSVIKRFLKDISDGHYDHYMDLSIGTFDLQNPAQRSELGLANDERGVLVTQVAPEGSSAGVLKKGDVLLSIDGHAISSDGFINLDGRRVRMPEVVERKLKGDSLKLKIWRDKKEQEVTVKLAAAWAYKMQARRYGVKPRYILFGGLLFQPLSRDFMKANKVDNLRLRYFYDNYVSNNIYVKHPDVIVLSGVLPDPSTTYIGDYKDSIVDEINGVKMRTLSDVASALAKPADYYVIKMIGLGRPLVLERSAVEAASARINQRYGVRSDENLKQ